MPLPVDMQQCNFEINLYHNLFVNTKLSYSIACPRGIVG